MKSKLVLFWFLFIFTHGSATMLKLPACHCQSPHASVSLGHPRPCWWLMALPAPAYQEHPARPAVCLDVIMLPSSKGIWILKPDSFWIDRSLAAQHISSFHWSSCNERLYVLTGVNVVADWCMSYRNTPLEDSTKKSLASRCASRLPSVVVLFCNQQVADESHHNCDFTTYLQPAWYDSWKICRTCEWKNTNQTD